MIFLAVCDDIEYSNEIVADDVEHLKLSLATDLENFLNKKVEYIKDKITIQVDVQDQERNYYTFLIYVYKNVHCAIKE